MFYERVQGNDTYNINTTPPFSYEPSANSVYFSNPNTSSLTGTTATLPFAPASLTNERTYYPNPGTAQFSLGIQRELAPSIVGQVGYVGTTGWNQNDLREINDLPLSDIADRKNVVVNSANSNFSRPFQGFSNIRQEENMQSFSYHSLQAALRLEERHGFSAQFSYTYSHEIDIQSADLTSDTLAGSGGTLSNPYNARYDHGSGGFDRRHIFNMNYIYSLPFFKHSGNELARQALGGWQIAGVSVFESGVPVNIYYNGPDKLGLGGNTANRPNFVSKVKYAKKQDDWFSGHASFADPIAPWEAGASSTTTGFGNASKDAVVGPGLQNWNISIYKEFALTSHEGPRFQFRAESYNTFNHTEFNALDTGTNDSNYGKITSTNTPRVLQFGGKFLF